MQVCATVIDFRVCDIGHFRQLFSVMRIDTGSLVWPSDLSNEASLPSQHATGLPYLHLLGDRTTEMEQQVPFLMKIFLKNKESATCYRFWRNCVDSFKPKLKEPPTLKKGSKGNLLSQTCPSLHGPRSDIPRLHVPFDSVTWLRWVLVKHCLWRPSEHHLLCHRRIQNSVHQSKCLPPVPTFAQLQPASYLSRLILTFLKLNLAFDNFGHVYHTF